MSRPETLFVRASHSDRPVPLERRRVKIDKETGRDTRSIYRDEPREVPNNPYYRRAIRRGDLEEAPRTAPAPTKPAASKAKASKKD